MQMFHHKDLHKQQVDIEMCVVFVYDSGLTNSFIIIFIISNIIIIIIIIIIFIIIIIIVIIIKKRLQVQQK